MLASDQTAPAIQKEEEETGAEEGDRDGDKQGKEFLPGFGGFGEEGHVQLRFVFRGL
jgi:hypothetical protein